MTGFDGVEGVRECSNDAAILAAYDLIRQLRPRLTDPGQWLDAYKRQAAGGYRVLLLVHDDVPQGLAGFRLQENLIHGRFLYVDDLVTDATLRGAGLGKRLLDALTGIARDSQCDHLVLDTALVNHDAQRFYTRCGMTNLATRFIKPLGDHA
ncbi:GNAT family N-acetyltransferase [Pseudomonas fluorescens]|uniref:GNAT family N-acetyltransferase n=1 Tax=Pseudomonas fluorescens TaxID=294 RepID=UPI0035267148